MMLYTDILLVTHQSLPHVFVPLLLTRLFAAGMVRIRTG